MGEIAVIWHGASGVSSGGDVILALGTKPADCTNGGVMSLSHGWPKGSVAISCPGEMDAVAVQTSLPPVLHAFHGSKVGVGQKLQQWQNRGLLPLAVALIGTDQAPPLWTHPAGCDFVRGSRLVAKPQVAQQRKLTRTQILLLQSLWTPADSPLSQQQTCALAPALPSGPRFLRTACQPLAA